MIVISGALVVVAFILLVFGIFDSELDFVYASIVVSGAAFVFLLIGIFQRRGETGEAKEGAAPTVADDADSSSSVTTVIPSAAAARQTIPVADSDAAADSEASEGTVLVVADRPRYHVAGCRYLAGKDADELDVRDARDEGFTPCGVCKPDANLVPVSAAVSFVKADTEDAELDDVDDTDSEEQPEPLASPTRTAPTRKAPAATAGRTVAKAAPTKAAPTRTTSRTATKAAPVKAAPVKAAPVKAAPAKAAPAKAAPAKTATTKAATTKAAPAKRTAATVVVIPDRGKFHTSQCRYVRGVDGAEELTKAQATRQGYDACGVCKP